MSLAGSGSLIGHGFWLLRARFVLQGLLGFRRFVVGESLSFNFELSFQIIEANLESIVLAHTFIFAL